MNLIALFTEELLTDTECPEKQSDYLKEIYQNSKNKTEINDCFICLCGYSLSFLIEMAS